jgi:hypothetical protein
MPKTPPSRLRDQRASRLSRDLLVRISDAGSALDKAHVLARKLQKAAPGEPTARLASELAAQIETAKAALWKRTGRPPSRSAARGAPRRRRG